MTSYAIDDITDAIIHEGMKIHRRFGPGLMESFYEILLARRLEQRGFRVERQKPISIEYDGILFEEVGRVDLLVEGTVVVEIKSVERLAPAHPKQLLTYLRVCELHVGLLLNFGAPTLLQGIRRVVNQLPASASPILRVNKTEGPGESPKAWFTRSRGARGESGADGALRDLRGSA